MKSFIILLCGFVGVSLAVDENPDAMLSTTQMIRRAGYHAEAHTILTEDGYLLEVHRIPGKDGSPAIFLQHGLLCSSADWVMLGKNKALAYILADKGYDVWLGNFRGNTYSRAHVSIPSSSSEFWDFSWHEMGIYDLPAMISYVTNLKKDLLRAYIGHSMGTTSFYVMAVERPEVTKLVKLMISLAPVSFLSHMKGPLRFIAPLLDNYKIISYFFGKDEFLPQNFVVRFLAKYGCDLDVLEEEICANTLFVIVGFDSAQFNYTLLPVILNHSPAGASTKTMIHYLQEMKSKHFRRYDYGEKKNMEIYNSTVPPDYDLSKISVPIAISYADNDWLTNPTDVMQFSKSLKNIIDMYEVPFLKFNHVDFLWAKDAPKLVYERLLYILKKNKKI